MSHWQSKAKITTADREFSLIVRELAGWKCQYRFKCRGAMNYKETGYEGSLTCSHFEKRAKRSVRFDLENCDAACRTCHGWVEDTAEGQAALKVWKMEQLDGIRYTNLILRANLPRQQKMDKKMETLYVRELRKQLVAEGKLKP